MKPDVMPADVSAEKMGMNPAAGQYIRFPEAIMPTAFDPSSIVIRPFNLDDVPSLYAAVHESKEQLRQWMTWCPEDYSIERARTFVLASGKAWAAGEQYSFAIINPKDDTFLGSVGLNQTCPVHKHANLGYWVRNSWAGRGVATAAVQLAAKFGLGELGLNRLEILVPILNKPSQRVAQKSGARFEGVLRNKLVLGGKSQDGAMFSLVTEDLHLLTPKQPGAGKLWVRS